MYLKDLIASNKHKLVRYNECKFGVEYVSVFDYSTMFGGTFDSHRYYNDYVIEL